MLPIISRGWSEPHCHAAPRMRNQGREDNRPRGIGSEFYLKEKSREKTKAGNWQDPDSIGAEETKPGFLGRNCCFSCFEGSESAFPVEPFAGKRNNQENCKQFKRQRCLG